MKIPNKLEEIIKQDQSLHSLVLDVVNDNSFGRILKDNKLFFFEEYTEHGIEHIEMALKAAEFLIPDESFQYIQPKEVAILILAVVLHDIGMHTEFSTFKAMIDGEYNDVRVDVLDKKTWKELWVDYLSEARHWSSKKLEEVFGNLTDIPQAPDLSNKDKLTGTDKKLIGEFIRRNHARLAHEIALKEFIGNDTISFGNSQLDERDKQLVGITARSHGINIRDTFPYLKEIAQDAWQYPDGLNVVFLMVLLRIADYLQIDKTRTNEILLKLKTLNSPVSLREHKAHLSIRHIHFGTLKELELIYVECNKPEDARMYVKIQTLVKDIQHELDLSWAVLGEVYGFNPENKPKFKFRRIDTNLEQLKLDYIPQKISFQVNNELSKLLVAPLYGDNPTYGVRELVQNSTDACKERMKIEQDNGNVDYEPLVTVSIDKTDEENYLFKIIDNGKGMTLNEIQNYFLSVGSSFRQTVEWKKEFEGKVSRNGRFGVGVLAAFLLGDEISVKTRSYSENITYNFRTKHDSEFVEIEKLHDNFEIGTKIEILMPFDRFAKLNEKGHKWTNDLLWFDWYIDEKPSIKYILCGKKQTKHMFFDPAKTRTIILKNKDKIHWSYQPIQTRFDPDVQHSGGEITNWKFVACNGMIITLNSEHPDFSQDNFSSIIYEKPSLIIEDSQNILPLRLDRNDLDANLLPFEDELLLDISNSFIAQLLTLPNISTQVQHDDNYRYFFHNRCHIDFCYSKNGFTLAYDYFIEKLRIKKYHLLRIITKWGRPDFLPIFQKFDNYIIYPEFDEITGELSSWENEEGYESTQASLVAPESGGCILLSQKIYNSFLNNNYPHQWSKYHFQMEWKNKKYIVFNLKHYKRKTNFFEEKICTSMLQKMGENIQSIQEIPFTYFNYRKSGKILNQLFEKYIGDNVIIPYDMEERKKLYPLAFEELKDYMKDYESK